MRDVQYGSFAVKTLQIRSTSANHSSSMGGFQMQAFDRPFISVRSAVRLALLGAGMVLPAQAVLAAEAQGQEIEEVVVTGFRGSLNTALSEKRSETAAVDVIAAEDIGKFPDSNLAESMQRIPGVALTRSDGGEGRNIA